jgi:hypothetical protein
MASPPPALSKIQRLQQSVQKQWFWIQEHVQRFDPTASASDFADRIVTRLLDRVDYLTTEAELDESVRNTAKLVCYEEHRRCVRREKRHVVVSEYSCPDPASLHFAAEAELQSDMDFIRRFVSPEQLELLESLYGFGEKEELTVEQLAETHGMKTMTMYQRLHRLYKRLQAEFRSRDSVS